MTTSTTQSDPDYSQFSFMAERTLYHTDFKTGLQWFLDRKKSERSILYKSIAITPNGQITIGTTSYNCTKWAFEQFCARLGIPKPFAKKIPSDLLLDNITRLIKEKAIGDNTQIQFHFADFAGVDTIVGCTKDEHQFIESNDFLTAVAGMDGVGYTLTDLVVTDRLIDVDLHVGGKVLSVNGEDFNVAINLRSSDCGDVNPTARLALYNKKLGYGCALSTDWGRVDRLRNKKMALETTFTNFMGKVTEMIIPETPLTAALKKLDTDVTDNELKNYYDTFNRAIDNKATIDTLLGFNEEERKETFKQISIRRKNNAISRLQGQPTQADPTLNFKKMQLAQIAGEYAKNAVIEEREALRRLAGSFVELG